MDSRKWGREDQNTMIEALEHEGGDMTSWEEAFIASVRARFNAGQELTVEQLQMLERLYEARR